MKAQYARESIHTCRIIDGIGAAIEAGTVTYDLARLMDGARQVSCSAFADAVIGHMN